MEDIYNMNVTALQKNWLFAELAEGKERFIPQTHQWGMDALRNQSWSISASIGLQRAGARIAGCE